MDERSTQRGRSRRAERAQHIYTSHDAYRQEENIAASQPDVYAAYTPNDQPVRTYAFTTGDQPVRTYAFTPNQPQDAYAAYTPNEPDDPYAGYTPNEQPDLSAYYSREGAAQETADEPAFAPPPKMDQYFAGESDPPVQQTEEVWGQNHVYRPREVTWVDAEEHERVTAEQTGYQVRGEKPKHKKRKKRKRHPVRNTIIVLMVLALIAGGLWVMREPVLEVLGFDKATPQPTAEPFTAVTTPQPVKAYDAAQRVEITDAARSNIAHLSGTVQMETYIVTDSHVVTRNLRAGGTYDFYLFTAAEGRLLCYFEGLGPLDMIPQEGGSFYVKQEPYLVASNGSALIRTANIESLLGDDVSLHPVYHGWAVVENEADGSVNYINKGGQLLSTLWFSRSFPFTGSHTLAYVDTGATAERSQRYLLYVLGSDGTMSRWLAVGDMTDTVGCAGGMAYMRNGALYQLPDTSKPLLHSSDVYAYLDCDAMVVRSEETGKYGLFVGGEQHYDFVYDEICPVPSDIRWDKQTFTGDSGSFTVCAVTGASYPQPLSYSFVLKRGGQSEYVALSATSSYPIRLDGEF